MESITELDELFKNSEHQKEIPISDQLIERMNTELDAPVRSIRIYKTLLGVAASLTLLVSIGILNRSNPAYQLEELIYETHPIVNRATIDILPNYPEMVYAAGTLKG